MEVKQDNIEEEEAKSTGNDSSHSSVNQINNSTGEESEEKKGLQNKEPDGEEIPATQANMSTPFDTKLKHVLNNYLSATGADHDIRKAFIHEQIFTFEEFTTGCDVENIKTFQQNDGTSLVQAFSNVKLKMICHVLLYYQILMDDSRENLAANPVI